MKKLFGLWVALACAACGQDAAPPAAGGAADSAGAGADSAVGAEAGAGSDSGAETGAGAEAGSGAETAADAAPADDASGLDSASSQDAQPADVPPPECSADQKKACNDGLTCTADTCAIEFGVAVCHWKLDAGACLIGGACQLIGDAKPNNACVQCLPESATATWTPAPDGSACDDGDLCTWQGKCAAKKCVSVPLVCDDNNPCTTQKCLPAKGCVYEMSKGAPCDDDNQCTTGDWCGAELKEGQLTCTGNTIGCDDKNPCTTDSCDLAKGCTHTDNADPCSDGNACTDADACKAGQCQSGAKPNCDDGNTCTLDLCDNAAGCYHLPLQSPCCTGQTSICDDGNPCTNDDCDPKSGGCSHAPNTAPCSDNNACTSPDACKDGKCAGGAAKICDDKNPCTADNCATDKGCVFSPQGTAACDDGNPCTKNDACNGGSCKGAGQCACTPTFAPQAIKFNSILIGNGGKPGEGIDLDDNPKTCAPASNCSNGINNALGALAGLANSALDKSVQDGAVSFILEFKDFKQGPINLALYPSKLDAASAGCDSTKQTCSYLVSMATLDPQKCTPTIALPGTLAGNLVNAGGKGSNFPIAIPLQAGVNLQVVIYGAKLVGNATLSGSNVTAFDGILSGAIPKTTLAAAIDALPPDGLPVPKDALKSILDTAVDTDIDSDGDGKLDAASIALKVKGTPGKIVGTY